jgi:hypothetical protein
VLNGPDHRELLEQLVLRCRTRRRQESMRLVANDIAQMSPA